MDRLTKEEIDNQRGMLKRATSHQYFRSDLKIDTLCDLALQSLSQESVRSEALEELAELSRKATQDLWRSDCILPPEHKTRLHTIRTADDPPTRIVADGLYERDGVFIVAIVNWFRANFRALSPARVAEGERSDHDVVGEHLRSAPESPAKEQPGEQKLGQGWIPVSERFPDENMRVLVRRGEGTELFNPCVARYQYQTGRGGWWQYEPDFVSATQPTHWRPLPPPPGRP